MKLVIASNNRGKLEELKALLPAGIELLTLADVDLDSPDETGTTFEENALIKARAAATSGEAAIADDSGLVVDALEGRPGVWSSRFAGEDASDEANNQKLLAELAEVGQEQRSARFQSVVALVLPDGQSYTATGSVEGRIGFAERGSGGFGYDPLMIVNDPGAIQFNGLTMAELSLDEKNSISHRARAYRSLLSVLRDAGIRLGPIDDSTGADERRL